MLKLSKRIVLRMIEPILGGLQEDEELECSLSPWWTGLKEGPAVGSFISMARLGGLKFQKVETKPL